MNKRTWCYLQPPKAFDVAPCACGNHDTQWSEFAGHLWCDACQIDFVPVHNGVFDGPIPAQTAHALGLRFDRLDLVTQRVQRWDPATGQYTEEAAAEPDAEVIVLGEVRSPDAACNAAKPAVGHTVLGTIHSDSILKAFGHTPDQHAP